MRLITMVAALLLLGAGASAQEPVTQASNTGALINAHDSARFEQPERPTANDPLATYLYPPELIMAHQRELGLQDDQRAKIISEIGQVQAKFVQLQWTMNAETERLQTLIAPAVVDEAQVLDQIDRVLGTEREIKRLQVTLLVRIKNSLTATQQAKLSDLRNGNGGKSVTVHVF